MPIYIYIDHMWVTLRSLWESSGPTQLCETLRSDAFLIAPSVLGFRGDQSSTHAYVKQVVTGSWVTPNINLIGQSIPTCQYKTMLAYYV